MSHGHDIIFLCCEGAVLVAIFATGCIIGYRRGHNAAKRDYARAYDNGFTAGELSGITEGYARRVKQIAPQHGPDGRLISKEKHT